MAMTRSENMSRIKGRDTSIEIKLRKALWSRGVRYRKTCKGVYGTPDICFKTKKIAIFCDSEFWHGKLYLQKKKVPKANTEYWVEKFKRNIARDQEVNAKLKAEGWTVLRFWESEINKDIETCVLKILVELKRRTLDEI